MQICADDARAVNPNIKLGIPANRAASKRGRERLQHAGLDVCFVQPQARAPTRLAAAQSALAKSELVGKIEGHDSTESRPFYLTMNSPISHLTEVLQKVRDSGQTFSAQLKGSEAATRAALIDPVLRALGWDVADPSRVLVEKTQTVGGKPLRVDYALSHEEEIKIVVEAKKLGGNLQDNFLQLVNYSFGLKVGNLWISDGVIWLHYQNISYSDTNPTREFDLSKDDLPNVAAYFVQHMDAAIISPQTPKIDELNSRIEKLENLVLQIQRNSKEDSKPKMAPKIVAPKVSPTANQEGDNWYSLDGGQKVAYKKASDATLSALKTLAETSVQILPELEKEMNVQLANRKKVVKRRWIAHSKEALYDNPKMWEKSVKIVPGWWLGTNYSNGDKRDLLAMATKVAANFGVKMEFHLV